MFFSTSSFFQDALREDCDPSEGCITNCCVNTVIAPLFFVVFVLMAQFVLVNVVVAVLMKHLEVPTADGPKSLLNDRNDLGMESKYIVDKKYMNIYVVDIVDVYMYCRSCQ